MRKGKCTAHQFTLNTILSSSAAVLAAIVMGVIQQQQQPEADADSYLAGCWEIMQQNSKTNMSC